MFKLALPVSLVLTAFSSFATSTSWGAEIYECSFTEPFVSVTYDSSKGILATVTPDSYLEQPDGSVKVVPVIEKEVSFKVVDAGKFELVKADGTPLYALELTNQGSDGMSDTIYPFDVRAKSSDLMPLDYLGGCSSTTLPAVQPAANAQP